jgi:hypothetical protein
MSRGLDGRQCRDESAEVKKRGKISKTGAQTARAMGYLPGFLGLTLAISFSINSPSLPCA